MGRDTKMQQPIVMDLLRTYIASSSRKLLISVLTFYLGKKHGLEVRHYYWICTSMYTSYVNGSKELPLSSGMAH